MYRAVVLSLVFIFASAVASAQQPCTSDARQVVNELYRHILEREADAGSARWVEQLENGQTVRSVVRGIATSNEYRQRFWQQEPGEETPFIRAVGTMYRHILGRAPDDAGARAWAVEASRTGMNGVVNRIIDSREYTQQFGDWGVPGSGGLRYCGVSNRGAVAPPAYPSSRRFRGMDRNNDGAISRNEWRGSVQAFDAYDRNNDGVLSGQEAYNATARSGRAFETAPTSGDLILVSSTRRWTDTGIVLRAGDTVTFDAQGTVRLGNWRNDVAGPAGDLSGRRADDSPLPNQAAGALIARIGESLPVFVGGRRSVRVPIGGRLYLGVNDDYLGDNAGEFEVSVTVQYR